MILIITTEKHRYTHKALLAESAVEARVMSYPELDRACWMALGEARRRILVSQLPIIDALEAKLRG